LFIFSYFVGLLQPGAYCRVEIQIHQIFSVQQTELPVGLHQLMTNRPTLD